MRRCPARAVGSNLAAQLSLYDANVSSRVNHSYYPCCERKRITIRL
jgi:hypothetical protein